MIKAKLKISLSPIQKRIINEMKIDVPYSNLVFNARQSTMEALERKRLIKEVDFYGGIRYYKLTANGVNVWIKDK